MSVPAERSFGVADVATAAGADIQLAAALEACPLAVIVCEASGLVLWRNARAISWTRPPVLDRGAESWNSLGLPWTYDRDRWLAVTAGAEHSLVPSAWRRPDNYVVMATARLTALPGAPGAAPLVVCYLDCQEVRGLAVRSAASAAWEWRPNESIFVLDTEWVRSRRIDCSVTEMSDAAWKRTLHPDDVAVLDGALRRVQSGADHLECEYRVARTDHSWLWVLQRGAVIERDAAGHPLTLVGLFVEIDARKQEYFAARDNEARLATALWGARAAFWQWHVPSDTGSHSPLWFAMTGYTRESWESIPHPWNSRLHPDDRARAMQQLEDHAAGRRDSIEYEYRIRVANGAWKWMLDRGRAVEWDLQGKPTLIIGVTLDIDSAKQAELELRSSESRLQTGVWGAGVGLWELNFETGLTSWFNDWCEQHDIDPCTGANHVARWDANLHPDEGPEAIRRFADHVAGEREYYEAEYRVRTRSGSWRWVLERGRVVDRATDGTARRMVGICLDIADRKASEAGLRAHVARLEAALTVAGGGSWHWSLHDDTMSYSDAYYRLFGVDPAAGRAEHNFWINRVHPADSPVPLEQLRRTLVPGNDVHEVEYRVRHSDGNWRWMLDRCRVLARDAAGQPAYIAGLLVDITDRKTRELALVSSDARFRTAAAAVRGIVYDTDLRSGTTLREGVERVLGYRPDEISSDVGSWFALCHPDDRATVDSHYADYLRTGVSSSLTYRVRHRDGHYISLWDCPQIVRDIDGTPIRSIGFAIDVTEDASREAALAGSEALFRSVAMLAPGYVWESRFGPNDESRMVRASAGFESIIGCSVEEFERAGSWMTFVAEESRAAAYNAVQRLRSGEPAVTVELKLRRLDNTELWLLVRAQAVKDALTGRIIGAIGSAEDVTERHHAEEALKRSQAQLMTIAQSTADWLLLVDASQRVVFINKSIVGRPPAEVVGRTIAEVAQPGAAEYMTELVAKVLATGTPTDVEQEYLDPQLGPRTFELRIRAVRAGERIAGVVMNATEITRRREADELRRTQARMLETLREAVAVIQSDGMIRLANPAFERLFAFEPKQAVGHSFASLIASPDSNPRERLERLMGDAIGMSSSSPLEFDCVARDGTAFTAACVASQIELNDGAHWLIALTDVTERKRMEREILEIASREQLRIGSDLHDGLGQDLTGIALMLRSVSVTLRKEGSPARAEIDDIISLVNTAIESTRAMARGLSPVGADRGGLIAGLQMMAARGIDRYGVRTELTTRLREPLSIDDATASHLYRIAQEALTNAIRHGHVTQVTIDLCTGDGLLVLTITDNGRGLPVANRSGDGMGLKLMRYRAQMMQGALTVSNHPEGGVVVQCTCPHRVRPEQDSRRSGGLPLKD